MGVWSQQSGSEECVLVQRQDMTGAERTWASHYQIDDVVRYTRGSKAIGIVESIAADGHVTARVDNSRQIEFDASEYRHFDHGYAVTSHSSQGFTAERVLVHGDTSVHPDLLNSRFAYVSISRASLDAKIYINDAADLGQRLSGEVSESPAIEFAHSTATAMTDLSLGRVFEVIPIVCCKTSLDMIK